MTDANVTLGRIDPDNFAGGTMKLDAALSARAIDSDVSEALSLSTLSAAFGISEVVEENMANAARVHAVERGKEIRGRTLVAFGGGAALHAARLARKLNIDEVIVPVAAGVGSAVGFLQAPVAYEVVRSRYALLDETFDATGLNALYAEMRAEAEQIVAEAAPDTDLIETRTADMRYHGQGHEIAVELPAGPYDVSLRDALTGLFETAYAATYSRRIPGLEVEVMNWTLRLSATVEDPAPCPPMPDATTPEPLGMRDLFDPDTGILSTAPVYSRDALTPGAEIAGPAIIAEDETTTIVLAGFTARLNAVGYIVMQWEGS